MPVCVYVCPYFALFWLVQVCPVHAAMRHTLLRAHGTCTLSTQLQCAFAYVGRLQQAYCCCHDDSYHQGSLWHLPMHQQVLLPTPNVALCNHDAINSLMSAAHRGLSLLGCSCSALSLRHLQVVLPVLPRHQGCLSLPSCLLCSPGCLPPEGAVPDERLQRFRHREHHVRHWR